MNAVVAFVCVAGCTLGMFLLAKLLMRGHRRTTIAAGGPGGRAGPEKPKYGNNRLPDFARESILVELQRHMQAVQPWLKVDLTLGELAAGINVSPHHLSQIINSVFGKSFACYINEYRVGEACQLLSGDNGKSVLDVALDSGFSSKSSFNASFKKHTGMTPSEFRKTSQDKNRLVA